MAPSNNKSLKDVAKENPTQIGDPVSLKAETSKNEPTNQDRPSKGDGKSLKQVAEERMETNPSMLGDPVSLKAETANSEPTDQDRGAKGPTKSSGKPKM